MVCDLSSTPPLVPLLGAAIAPAAAMITAASPARAESGADRERRGAQPSPMSSCRSGTHLLTYLRTYLPTHLPTHLPVRLLTHSLTYLLTAAKPKELVQEWDRKGKGEVNKVEFRQGVVSIRRSTPALRAPSCPARLPPQRPTLRAPPVDTAFPRHQGRQQGH